MVATGNSAGGNMEEQAAFCNKLAPKVDAVRLSPLTRATPAIPATTLDLHRRFYPHAPTSQSQCLSLIFHVPFNAKTPYLSAAPKLSKHVRRRCSITTTS